MKVINKIINKVKKIWDIKSIENHVHCFLVSSFYDKNKSNYSSKSSTDEV